MDALVWYMFFALLNTPVAYLYGGPYAMPAYKIMQLCIINVWMTLLLYRQARRLFVWLAQRPKA